MNLTKMAAAFFIIAIALVGGYFMLQKSFPAPLTNNNSAEGKSDNSNNILGKNPIQWVEQIVKENISSSSQGGIQGTTNGLKTNSTSSDNLTQVVAASLFGQMQNLDQSGNNPFTNFNANDPESQKLLAEAINGLQQNQTALFDQPIDDKNLKISNDNSQESKIRYLEAIKGITDKFYDPKYQRSPEQIINDVNQDCLGQGGSLNRESANLYSNMAVVYSALNVPSDWLDFHKKIISHFKSSNQVFQALANCINDPIKGYLAVNFLPQLVEEAYTIQDMTVDKYKEVGLD